MSNPVNAQSNTKDVPAVLGENTDGGDALRGYGTGAGRGVVGVSDSHTGVEGNSTGGDGVFGSSKSGTGVVGVSESGEAIHGETHSPGVAAIAAFNLAPNGTGAAVFARKEGSIGHAGYFDGDVHVTRSITIEGDVMLQNADCAEEFTVSDTSLAPPGTVLVIGDDGVAVPCAAAYDHRVVGVVSGGGDFRPALILDRQGGSTRRPVALMGKVFCQVDADQAPVRPGDLLTTAPTPGHAMRAVDAARAAGAMIGKALAPLEAGRGMIPILAMLQ